MNLNIPLRYIKWVLIFIGVVVPLLWLRSCITDKKPLDFGKPLLPDTAAHVAIDGKHVAIRTHKEVKATYVPSDGHAVATVKKDGSIDLKVTNKGFMFHPVHGVVVTSRLSIALGAQVAYWDRFEIHVGGKWPLSAAYLGAAYRLDQIKYLQNTSLMAVYTTRRELGVGIVHRF